MKIIRTKNYEDMSRKAANIISAQVILKPDCVLGLATGGTPVGTYEQLVEWYNKGDIDFSGVTTVNLDEYPAFFSPLRDQPSPARFHFKRKSSEHLLQLVVDELDLGADDDLACVLAGADDACSTCSLDSLLIDLSVVALLFTEKRFFPKETVLY